MKFLFFFYTGICMLWHLRCVAITLPAVHVADWGLQVARSISCAEHLADLLNGLLTFVIGAAALLNCKILPFKCKQFYNLQTLKLHSGTKDERIATQRRCYEKICRYSPVI